MRRRRSPWASCTAKSAGAIVRSEEGHDREPGGQQTDERRGSQQAASAGCRRARGGRHGESGRISFEEQEGENVGAASPGESSRRGGGGRRRGYQRRRAQPGRAASSHRG